MKPLPTPPVVKVPTKFVVKHPDEIFGCIDQRYAEGKKSWCHIGMIAKTIGCTEDAFSEWSNVGKYEAQNTRSSQRTSGNGFLQITKLEWEHFVCSLRDQVIILICQSWI